jgi:hypothetical protein
MSSQLMINTTVDSEFQNEHKFDMLTLSLYLYIYESFIRDPMICTIQSAASFLLHILD